MFGYNKISNANLSVIKKKCWWQKIVIKKNCDEENKNYEKFYDKKCFVFKNVLYWTEN